MVKRTISKESEDKIFFWGGIFSNFFEMTQGIDYKGHNFKTTEHAFMYAKAVEFNDEEIAEQILVARTPKDAKRLGRKVKNFDDTQWNKVNDKIMKEINLKKFSKSPYKEQLMKTGNKELVEASPFDKIWGIGLSVTEDIHILNNKSNWNGQNKLGEVLMEVRDILRRGENKCLKS